MSTEYNGWRNVETWRVQLHIANDEGEAEHMLNHARWRIGSPHFDEAADGMEFFFWSDGGPPEKATMADYVRGYVTQEFEPDPERPRGTWEMLAADTVAAAMQRVDWEQIAAYWLEAARHEMAPTAGLQNPKNSKVST